MSKGESAKISIGPQKNKGNEMKRILVLLLILLVGVTGVCAEEESILGRGIRAVIGNDDRQPVPRPELTGFAPIGFVIGFFPNGYISQCTGTLIGTEVVVTAGHCLECLHGKATNVLFVPAAGPGWSLPSFPYGWGWAVKWIWWLTAPIPGQVYQDLGFLRLNNPLGLYAGYYPPLYANSDYPFSWSGPIVGWNAGYPGDLQFNTYEGLEMWASCCYLRSWSNLFVGQYTADCDMYNGSSGGPFLTQSQNGTWGVIGVATLEYGNLNNAWAGFGTGVAQAVNYFMPITENLYQRAINYLYE